MAQDRTVEGLPRVGGWGDRVFPPAARSGRIRRNTAGGRAVVTCGAHPARLYHCARCSILPGCRVVSRELCVARSSSGEGSFLPEVIVPGRHRVSFSRIPEVLPLPDLVGIQRESFDWLLTEGIREVLEEVSPIEDFTGTFQLSFRNHQFKDGKNSVEECKDKDMTYSAPLF